MTQSTLFKDPATTFDQELADKLRTMGMDRAGANRAKLLELARQVAIGIAKRQGTVTIDDVQKELVSHGCHPADLGNAAGLVFFGGEWACAGYTKSTRVSNRGRMIMVHRLKEF